MAIRRFVPVADTLHRAGFQITGARSYEPGIHRPDDPTYTAFVVDVGSISVSSPRSDTASRLTLFAPWASGRFQSPPISKHGLCGPAVTYQDGISILAAACVLEKKHFRLTNGSFRALDLKDCQTLDAREEMQRIVADATTTAFVLFGLLEANSASPADAYLLATDAFALSGRLLAERGFVVTAAFQQLIRATLYLAAAGTPRGWPADHIGADGIPAARHTAAHRATYLAAQAREQFQMAGYRNASLGIVYAERIQRIACETLAAETLRSPT